MLWKEKRIRVLDVVEEPRVDSNGVRDGWMATIDDGLTPRMFFPRDMFTFEPDEGGEGSGS